MSFNESSFDKKLQTLQQSQESIQTLSLYCYHHRRDHAVIVQRWLRAYRHSSAKHRLTLFFLANDVIQSSGRKDFKAFKQSFLPALKEALVLAKNDKYRPEFERVLKIWGERGVFEPEYHEQLESLIGTGSKPGTSSKSNDDKHKEKESRESKEHKEKKSKSKSDTIDKEALLQSFRTKHFMEELEQFQSLEISIERAQSLLPNLNFDVGSGLKEHLKDRSQGLQISSELDDTHKKLSEFVQELERHLQQRRNLISLLEQAKIFYETQLSEAGIVEKAYRTFGDRIKQVKEELDVMKINLPSSPNTGSPLRSHSRRDTQSVEMEIVDDEALRSTRHAEANAASISFDPTQSFLDTLKNSDTNVANAIQEITSREAPEYTAVDPDPGREDGGSTPTMDEPVTIPEPLAAIMSRSIRPASEKNEPEYTAVDPDPGREDGGSTPTMDEPVTIPEPLAAIMSRSIRPASEKNENPQSGKPFDAMEFLTQLFTSRQVPPPPPASGAHATAASSESTESTLTSAPADSTTGAYYNTPVPQQQTPFGAAYGTYTQAESQNTALPPPLASPYGGPPPTPNFGLPPPTPTFVPPLQPPNLVPSFSAPPPAFGYAAVGTQAHYMVQGQAPPPAFQQPHHDYGAYNVYDHSRGSSTDHESLRWSRDSSGPTPISEQYGDYYNPEYSGAGVSSGAMAGRNRHDSITIMSDHAGGANTSLANTSSESIVSATLRPGDYGEQDNIDEYLDDYSANPDDIQVSLYRAAGPLGRSNSSNLTLISPQVENANAKRSEAGETISFKSSSTPSDRRNLPPAKRLKYNNEPQESPSKNDTNSWRQNAVVEGHDAPRMPSNVHEITPNDNALQNNEDLDGGGGTFLDFSGLEQESADEGNLPGLDGLFPQGTQEADVVAPGLEGAEEAGEEVHLEQPSEEGTEEIDPIDQELYGSQEPETSSQPTHKHSENPESLFPTQADALLPDQNGSGDYGTPANHDDIPQFPIPMGAPIPQIRSRFNGPPFRGNPRFNGPQGPPEFRGGRPPFRGRPPFEHRGGGRFRGPRGTRRGGPPFRGGGPRPDFGLRNRGGGGIFPSRGFNPRY